LLRLGLSACGCGRPAPGIHWAGPEPSGERAAAAALHGHLIFIVFERLFR